MTGTRVRITTRLQLSTILHRIKELSEGLHPKAAHYVVEINKGRFVFKERRLMSRNPPPRFEGIIKELADGCAIDGIFRAGIFDSVAVLFSIVWSLVACMILMLFSFFSNWIFSFGIGFASISIGIITTIMLVRINSRKNKVFFDALLADLRRIFVDDSLNHDT